MKVSRRDFIRRSLSLGGVVMVLPGLATCAGKSVLSSANAEEPGFVPGYKRLEEVGKLTERVEQLWSIYESCHLCPRTCGVNRLKGEKGVCQGSSKVKFATAYPHFGEERCLVGTYGSGAIFFSNCNLRCVFCINFHISQEGEGREISDQELANQMLKLQKRGCRNINIVTPSHYVPNMVKAVQMACRKGLNIPLVYNTSPYDGLETIKLLDGIIDIYLPDFKYMDGKNASKYSSGAYDYPEVAAAVIKEMHRQVGVLKTDSAGNAYRGLIIRHLVMPNNVSNTDQVLTWIGENLPKNTYVNLMAQYRPMYKAFDYAEINRRLTRKEFQQAIEWAKAAGLTNLDQNSLSQMPYLS
jgi:putative pyruvate formate lyase activating enzyme